MTPATDTPSEAAVPQLPAAAPEHACDVLIADDSTHSREILTNLLRSHAMDLSVRQVRDGSEALSAFWEHKPRVTFLDIDMPGQDGLSVLQTIRRKRRDAFIVIVSGHSSAENVRQALSAGANGFIVKPFKPQRIIDVLERYRSVTGHRLVASDGALRPG
jgi:two-component system chemotaxis response regulator CheY